MNKGSVIAYTGILLIAAFALLAPVVFAWDGSITVCKIIVDQNGNVVNGSAVPSTLFSVYGIIPPVTSDALPIGKIGATFFSTPLTFNTNLIGDFKKDGTCVIYSALDIGTYYYGQETIVGFNWESPLYNDQYSTPVANISNFFPYDGTLFDGNPSNDYLRNLNSDGAITLTESRKNRVLVVLNRYKGPICGNGLKEANEQCDDGNLVNGDGCSNICKLEKLFCNDTVSQKGWAAKYYNYPRTHPDMNLPPDQWPDNGHGDPLGAWDTDWYTSSYYKFSRIDSNLTFGENFFPFDVAPEEIDNGHDYHFGAHWRALVNATPGDYSYTLTSDDDAWVYKDGVLVTSNPGVHPPSTVTGTIHLDGQNVMDIFFAERHVVRSHMYFKFTSGGVKIIPLPEECERCGDGIKQGNEQCDDGNTNNNDGCSNVCKLETCGDGIKQNNEQCDDGNNNDNDGCSSVCKLEVCGDSIVQPPEQCDDGNLICTDACNNCQKTICGDGVIQNPNGYGQMEVCDDGNTNNNDGCSSVCKLEVCGDGIKQNNEQCDDGNNVNNDSCTNTCKLPVCGDSITQPPEQCDDGNTINNDTCSNTCKFPICGDGIKQNGEQCDDGNNVNNDSCSNTCKFPVCGDSIIQPGETCDDGNNMNGDGCSSVCQQEACGNGILDSGEECDDHNNINGDGCSAVCKIEFCGDHIINNGEQCDDGNHVNGDGCDATCHNEFCGDQIKQPSEMCEPPSSDNNAFCSQTTSLCSGAKLGTRDANGACNSLCGCVPDPFIFQCVEGQCGATCDATSDFTLVGGTCTFGCVLDTCGFTSQCSIVNHCEGNTYAFSGQCGSAGCSFTRQNCDALDNKESFVNYCLSSEIRTHRMFHDYSCGVGGCSNVSSFIDDSLVQNCNLLDGYYDTGAKRNVTTGQCTEKQQKEQEYRDYTCSSTPGVACTYVVTGTQWIDTGTQNKPDGTTCDDGLFCTVNDVCTTGLCGGVPRVCESNQCTIGTCNEQQDICIQITIPDNTTPITTKVYGQPYYSNGTSEWINSSTKITLIASDTLVCPSTVTTYYRITLVPDVNCRQASACNAYVSNGKWNTYSTPFTIGEQSCHLIEFNSMDNSGNNETRHRQCAFVDNTGPLLNKTVGQPRTIWTGDDTFYPGLTDICNKPDGIDCFKVTMFTPITLACNDGQPHPVSGEELHFIIGLDGDDATPAYCAYYDGIYNTTGDGSCIVDNPITIRFLEESQHNLLAYCVDKLGNRGPSDDEKFKVEGKKFTIRLNKKWNLISVPYVLINDDPAAVFANVANNISSVWTYDPTHATCSTDWCIWTPDADPDTLTEILPGRGYWIMALENSTLVIGGSLFGPGVTPPSHSLAAGWDLIGYYGDNGLDSYNGPAGAGNVATCELGSLVDTVQGHPKWSALYSYWEPYVNKWIALDENDNMDPGAGYWIEMDVTDLYSPSTTCSGPLLVS